MSLIRTKINVIKEKIIIFINQYCELAPPRNFEKWFLNPHPISSNNFNTDEIIKRLAGAELEEASKSFVQRVLQADEKIQPNVSIGMNAFSEKGVFDFSERDGRLFDPLSILSKTPYDISILYLYGPPILVVKGAKMARLIFLVVAEIRELHLKIAA